MPVFLLKRPGPCQVPCGHGSKSKSYIPIPTKIPTKTGGAPSPTWDPIGFDNHSHVNGWVPLGGAVTARPLATLVRGMSGGAPGAERALRRAGAHGGSAAGGHRQMRLVLDEGSPAVGGWFIPVFGLHPSQPGLQLYMVFIPVLIFHPSQLVNLSIRIRPLTWLVVAGWVEGTSTRAGMAISPLTNGQKSKMEVSNHQLDWVGSLSSNFEGNVCFPPSKSYSAATATRACLFVGNWNWFNHADL